MKKCKILVLLALFAYAMPNSAQTKFKTAENFQSYLPDSLTKQIISSLDNLLASIENGKLDTTLIDHENFDFNRNFFPNLKDIEGKDTIKNYFQGQLINLYPVENKQYSITVAYMNNNEIGRIFNFLAKEENDKIVLSSPIKYNTKHWKTTTIGTITCFYPDTIDLIRAEKFNQKNIAMAQKLNLPLRDWEIYMCKNYQEALQIQGCLYEYSRNGYINSGDIADPKTLFSVMNDEDFSHDILHIYALEVRGKIRNVAAEEGIAYLWGNAYHAGNMGKSPEQDELVNALRKYIQSHSGVKLLDLFDKNPNILAEYGYPKPISVKSTISGIICAEIEKQKGADGIIELMKCGRGDENYFKSIEKITGINRENFNDKVYRLLFQ
ncbi:MAG: hypothetical protein LBH32_11540 [Dysgonamonadaceae bacterium]|jgi:hypothetical protein|nr:hypothetical protein [Dysgonamonadaceae bacterium]